MDVVATGLTTTGNVAVFDTCPRASVIVTPTVSVFADAKVWDWLAMVPAAAAEKVVLADPSPQLTETEYGPVALDSVKLPRLMDWPTPAFAVCDPGAVTTIDG
jgi:hypothetical protein